MYLDLQNIPKTPNLRRCFDVQGHDPKPNSWIHFLRGDNNSFGLQKKIALKTQVCGHNLATIQVFCDPLATCEIKPSVHCNYLAGFCSATFLFSSHLTSGFVKCMFLHSLAVLGHLFMNLQHQITHFVPKCCRSLHPSKCKSPTAALLSEPFGHKSLDIFLRAAAHVHAGIVLQAWVFFLLHSVPRMPSEV